MTRFRVLWAAGAAIPLPVGGISPAAMKEPVRIEARLVSGVAGRDASVTVCKGVPYALRRWAI